MNNIGIIQNGFVVGFVNVAFERQKRGDEFIQFEARLQNSTINVSRMDAKISTLSAEYIGKHSFGTFGIGVQNGRKTPKQAVAIPIGCTYIVARASAGNEHQLFRVKRNTGREEHTEEQIRIVEFCEFCITIKGDTTLLKPSSCFCKFYIESLPKHLFGACCGSNFLETETPIKYDRGCSIGSNCTVMG